MSSRCKTDVKKTRIQKRGGLFHSYIAKPIGILCKSQITLKRFEEKKRQTPFVPYLLVDRPEEVDLICQTFQLGLQLNLVHVGLIHILVKQTCSLNRHAKQKELNCTRRSISAEISGVITDVTFLMRTKSFSHSVRLLISSSYLSIEEKEEF